MVTFRLERNGEGRDGTVNGIHGTTYPGTINGVLHSIMFFPPPLGMISKELQDTAKEKRLSGCLTEKAHTAASGNRRQA